MLPPIDEPEDPEVIEIDPEGWTPQVWTGGPVRSSRTFTLRGAEISGPSRTIVSDGSGNITWASYGNVATVTPVPRPSFVLDDVMKKVLQSVPDHPGLVTDTLWAAVINPGGSSVGRTIKDRWPSSRIIGYEPAGGGSPLSVYDDWLYGQVHRSAEHHEGLYNLVITQFSPEYAVTQVETGMKLLVDGGYQVAVMDVDFLHMSSFNRRNPAREIHLLNRLISTRVYISIWQKGWTGDTLLRWIDQE